jgi:hypothetical protein
MRHQWYDPAREASRCEPGFVCYSMAQEIVDPTQTGKDRLALYATEREAA